MFILGWLFAFVGCAVYWFGSLCVACFGLFVFVILFEV